MKDSSRHAADTLELKGCARPPGPARVKAVRDVLLVPATHEHVTEEDWRRHPPAGAAHSPVNLGRGLSIVHRLGGNQDKLVMFSCEPRGHFFVPTFPFGVRQAYVRRIPLANYQDNPYSWDPDGTISVAYKLSRLVRDNATSTEYSARIVNYSDGQQSVIPGPVSGEWATTYRAGTGRAWLDDDDVGSLRAVVEAYWGAPEVVTGRLGRAVDCCEWSVHHPFATDTVREVVTGLEALLKTHRHQATRQFVERVPALARELGISGVTRRFCEQMYRWRSQASHGARVTMFAGAARSTAGAPVAPQLGTLRKVALIQEVLRRAIGQMLLDPRFRQIFDRPARIRARWPVITQQGRSM